MTAETRTPDVPMLRKLVEWVRAEDALPKSERSWDQFQWIQPPGDLDALAYREDITSLVTWDCGTKACVCGRLAMESSAKITWQSSSYGDVLLDGMDPVDYGAERLGISKDQAQRLFYGLNTADDVARIASEIAGESL